MRSSRAGFTLVEVLVVMALFITLGGLALFMGMDFYRGYNIEAERNTVVSILAKARSRSMNNIDSSPHGVYIDSGDYILFQGASYASRDTGLDEVFDKSPAFTTSGLDEIVFDQLTGDVSSPGTITINGQSRTLDIEINNEGRIDW